MLSVLKVETIRGYMPEFQHKDEEFAHGHEISVDAHPNDYAWSEWTVYPSYSYEVGEYEGRRFLYVYEDEAGKWFTDRRKPSYKPLSRQYAALFLEFARWPEEHSMDMKPLASSKNEAAAVAWAESYGLLGLTPPGFEVWSGANDVIKHHLGMRGTIRRRTRNDAKGGLEDSVEAFAREAWIANTALRLYEAATKPEGPDMEVLEIFMPDRSGMDMPSIRDLYSRKPKSAQDWSLRIVSEIVEGKMRGRVWPIPVRDGVSAGHSRGWAFDSLLGAMWLQMSWLMSGKAKRCEWCGELLNIDLEWAMSLPKARQSGEATRSAGHLAKEAEDMKYQRPRKPRSDRRFCKNNGRCKAAWNYHYGPGASSKSARKEKRESGDSDAT